MRAIHTGNTYHIYDNSVQLYNGLPPKIYGVNFDPMKGFSLYAKSNISIKEKVYGVHETKIDKVFSAFKSFDRSLGVILSGDKGIGKSLFAKMLCAKAVELDYPVIIVDEFVPGIAQYIESIDQETVVLFDEFDKTFKKSRNDDAPDAQAGMLSLFDGTSVNKKLFCVTCNEMMDLNNFLVDRPGRFHYHFRFEYPTAEEIGVYMRDHLPENKHSEIDKVVEFARKVNLNYDCLRAICYELNRADNFEDAVSDLNIIKPKHGQDVKIFVLFEDGSRFWERHNVDLFGDDDVEMDFGNGSAADDDYIIITFNPCEMIYSDQLGGYYLSSDRLTIKEVDDVNDPESWVNKHHGEYVSTHRAKHVTGILIKPMINQKSIHYFKA